MLLSPSTFLIGAASRNVGKTEFACDLIRCYAHSRKVVALKITTVTVCDGKCPRGGQGCGVCSSLKENFEITEERCGGEGKDTARMREAGAEMVFWLRVQRDHLQEGVSALYARIPADAIVVCESNSARATLHPGLFFVIRQKGSTHIKESCERVISYADKVIEFDGRGWSVMPTQVVFQDGCWRLLEAV